MKILLTHSPEAFALYYGERALSALRQAGEVQLNHQPESLDIHFRGLVRGDARGVTREINNLHLGLRECFRRMKALR